MKRIIVVLGMHRSGTSAITRGLQVLGVDLGDNLMPPARGNNDKGFWEDLDIYALNVELLQFLGHEWHTLSPISPEELVSLDIQNVKLRAIELLRGKLDACAIFGLKDPRIARLLPFWQSVFEQLDVEVSYVIANRNPLSIARSLATRDGFDIEKSYYLWLDYMLSSLVYSQGKSRLVVDYDDLMDEAEVQLQRISDRLNLDFDPLSGQFIQYQNEFLDKALQHAHFRADDLALHNTAPEIVVELYTLLRSLGSDQAEIDDSKSSLALDHLKIRFRELDAPLRFMRVCDDRLSECSRLLGARNIAVTELIKQIATPESYYLKAQLRGSWYLEQNPDLAEAGVDPYAHWFDLGGAEGRPPAPDLVAFVRELVSEREQSLRSELFQKERELHQMELEFVVQRNELSTELLQIKLQAHDEVEAHCRMLAEREQIFAERLAERERSFSEQLAIFQETSLIERTELKASAQAQQEAQRAEHKEREEALLDRLGQLTAHINEVQQRARDREHFLEQESGQLRHALRAETEDLLRQLAERERLVGERLASMEEEARKERAALQASTRAMLDAQRLEYNAREEALRGENEGLLRQMIDREREHNLAIHEQRQALQSNFDMVLKDCSDRLDFANRTISRLKSSWSWRLTAFLRAIGRLTRLTKSALDDPPSHSFHVSSGIDDTQFGSSARTAISKETSNDNRY